MTKISNNRQQNEFPLESVSRIVSFPMVQSSISIAGQLYDRVKHLNPLMEWSLYTAEQSLAIAKVTTKPAMILFNGPITTIDQLLCKGIDMVEQRVPAVHFPPHLVYSNTREFVNNKLVRPVLIRADSVAVLGTHAANAAVDSIDGVINVADEYVDRYLPADPDDKAAETTVDNSVGKKSGSKAVRTIEHGARFSRKLQRRLTRRTIAEARALKEQGTECIHVLFYVAELIVTNPRLAWQKAKELWQSLSLPEPENQARPTTLEQLLVLCSREAARRIVHLVNGSGALASRAPHIIARKFIEFTHRLAELNEAIIKIIQNMLQSDASSSQLNAIRVAIIRLNCSTNLLLEQFATVLAGRPKNKTKSSYNTRQMNHYNHIATHAKTPKAPTNGIE